MENKNDFVRWLMRNERMNLKKAYFVEKGVGTNLPMCLSKFLATFPQDKPITCSRRGKSALVKRISEKLN